MLHRPITSLYLQIIVLYGIKVMCQDSQLDKSHKVAKSELWRSLANIYTFISELEIKTDTPPKCK